MNGKKIIACVDAQNEKREAVLALAAEYDGNGVDGLYLYNYSRNEKEREEFIGTLREIKKATDLPFFAGCYAARLEDVKKLYYSGASKLVLDMEYVAEPGILREAVLRFGGDRIYAEVNCGQDYKQEPAAELTRRCAEYLEMGVCGIMMKHVTLTPELTGCLKTVGCPVLIRDSLQRNTITSLLELPQVAAVATNFYAGKDVLRVKKALKEDGIESESADCLLSFAELKKDGNGLVPVIVQEYRTNEVLMLAYMNEEAYNKTMETGRMTYFSRSRQSLWVKGETSGHTQFVKSLRIDCDGDTILAKVKQIGAACHTGNRSCFYRELLAGNYENNEISHVLNTVFDTIRDRKLHPKEGSYTNYLFDKGIDKILKKCGEEATEMVIAAKNPDAEELRYEIADLLYHMMVLMTECGLDWQDIATELANRK